MHTPPDSTYTVLRKVVELEQLRALFATVFATQGVSAGEVVPQTVAPVGEGVCAIGAWVADDLVGGLIAYELPLLSGIKEMYLYDIAVLPAHQRQGIGTGLIAALKAEASVRGITTVFVDAEADDVEAVAFYRSLGVAELSVRHFTIPVR